MRSGDRASIDPSLVLSPILSRIPDPVPSIAYTVSPHAIQIKVRVSVGLAVCLIMGSFIHRNDQDINLIFFPMSSLPSIGSLTRLNPTSASPACPPTQARNLILPAAATSGCLQHDICHLPTWLSTTLCDSFNSQLANIKALAVLLFMTICSKYAQWGFLDRGVFTAWHRLPQLAPLPLAYSRNWHLEICSKTEGMIKHLSEIKRWVIGGSAAVSSLDDGTLFCGRSVHNAKFITLI